MTKRQLNNLRYGDKIVHIKNKNEYWYGGKLQAKINDVWVEMLQYYNSTERFARTTENFIITFDNVKL